MRPVAVVSGSGLDLRPLLDSVARETPFRDVPGLPDAGAQGHEGVFVEGEAGGRPVIVQMGRLHLYEGHDYAAAVSTVDALRAMGVDTVVFMNAVGGLRPAMRPGDLVAVDALAPFAPPVGFRLWPGAPRRIETHGLLPGCDHQGAYAFVLGPNYETRAEIRALQRLGAAVVGMSTAPEVHRCGALGMRALAVSCVTNHCDDPEPLTHAHVLEVAARASERLVTMLRGWLDAG